MIIRTQQDVWDSPFLSKIDKVAQKYGCDAEFIAAQDPPDIEGLYVAVYTDKKHFPSPSSELVRKYVQENARDVGLNLKCRMFRLNGYDDFTTHEHILTHLQNTELVLRAYQQNSIVPPGKVAPDFVAFIRSLYYQSVSFSNSKIARASYKEQLSKILQETLKMYDAKNDKVKIDLFYDTGLSEKKNRKRNREALNCVTAEHLTRVTGQVESIYIRAKFKDDIVNALNKTNYLYSMSPTVGYDLNDTFSPEELHGSKKNNDTRKFVLSYDGRYSREVRQVYEKVLFPSLFRMDYAAFKDYYSPLGRVQITQHNISDFVRLCNEKRVPYIYDKQGDVSSLGSLPIIYPETEKGKMDTIMRTLAKKSEEMFFAKDGLIREEDILTEKDIMNGTVITPEMKDRVRLFGKRLDEIPVRGDCDERE